MLPKDFDRETFIERLRAEHARILPDDIVFAVENGWLKIIEVILDRISDSLTTHGWIGKAQVKQIKEKLGELRIYVRSNAEGESFPDDLADELAAYRRIGMDASTHTCEICGELGETGNFGGYFQTLCPKHADQRRAWVARGREGDIFHD